MSVFDSISDALEGAVAKFKGTLGKTEDGPIGGITLKSGNVPGINYVPGTALESILPDFKETEFLVVDPRDWYKLFPYQFKITVGKTAQTFTYTLPIPPEQYVIKMVMASEVTPTMGGMVEETSANKIWMINLAGTTGMAVSRDGNAYRDAAKNADLFRHTLTTTGLLSGAKATLDAVGSKAVGAFNAVSQAAGDINNPGALGADLASVVSSILQPTLPYSSSAVDGSSNGYSEMNRLHKFLYMYSVIHEADPAGTSLSFYNYKDSQTFRVVVKDFNIQKSAGEPYLYRYKISLKAWDAAGIEDSSSFEVNRFDPKNGDLKTVNTLTITGIAAQVKGATSGLSLLTGPVKFAPAVL